MAASAAAAGSSPGLCPSFAVICSFLERYGGHLDLPELTFPQLERYLQETATVPKLLVDLHVKLLRKIGKSVSADRWEKYLVKACQEFNTTWAWELEKKGYCEMTLEFKTGILKYLCECQFDDNVKFKTAINEEDPDKMRLQPIGRDKDGLMYWFQLDQDHNVRVYVEEQDDLDGTSWKCIVRNRTDLAQILALLKTQIDPALLVKKDQEEGSSSNGPNPEATENEKKEDNGALKEDQSLDEAKSPKTEKDNVLAGTDGVKQESAQNNEALTDKDTKEDVDSDKPAVVKEKVTNAVKEEPMEEHMQAINSTSESASEKNSAAPPSSEHTEDVKKKSDEIQKALKIDQQAKIPLKKREMKRSEDFDPGNCGSGGSSIIVCNPAVKEARVAREGNCLSGKNVNGNVSPTLAAKGDCRASDNLQIKQTEARAVSKDKDQADAEVKETRKQLSDTKQEEGAVEEKKEGGTVGKSQTSMAESMEVEETAVSKEVEETSPKLEGAARTTEKLSELNVKAMHLHPDLEKPDESTKMEVAEDCSKPLHKEEPEILGVQKPTDRAENEEKLDTVKESPIPNESDQTRETKHDSGQTDNKSDAPSNEKTAAAEDDKTQMETETSASQDFTEQRSVAHEHCGLAVQKADKPCTSDETKSPDETSSTPLTDCALLEVNNKPESGSTKRSEKKEPAKEDTIPSQENKESKPLKERKNSTEDSDLSKEKENPSLPEENEKTEEKSIVCEETNMKSIAKESLKSDHDKTLDNGTMPDTERNDSCSTQKEANQEERKDTLKKTEEAPSAVSKTEAAPSPLVSKIEETFSPSISKMEEAPSPSISKTEESPSISKTEEAPSPSISKTEEAPSSISKTEEAPSPSISKTEEAPSSSMSKTDEAPSPSMSKTDEAPSPSISKTNKAPSPSISKTDKAPSPSISKTDKAPSPSISKTDKAPSPSISKTDKAPSPSISKTEEAPSPSISTTDKALSPSISKTEEAPSPSISKTVEAPSPTVAKIEEAPSPSISKTVEAPSPTVAKIEEAPSPSICKTEEAPSLSIAKTDEALSPTVAKMEEKASPTKSKTEKAPSPLISEMAEAPSSTSKSDKTSPPISKTEGKMSEKKPIEVTSADNSAPTGDKEGTEQNVACVKYPSNATSKVCDAEPQKEPCSEKGVQDEHPTEESKDATEESNQDQKGFSKQKSTSEKQERLIKSTEDQSQAKEKEKTETNKGEADDIKVVPEAPQKGIRLKIKVPAHRRRAGLQREEGKRDSESEASEGRCLRRSPRICRPTAKLAEIQDRKVEKKPVTPSVEKEKEENKEKEGEENAVQKKPREKKVEREGQAKPKGRRQRRVRWSMVRSRRKKKGSEEDDDDESSSEEEETEEDDSDEDYQVEKKNRRRNRNKEKNSSDTSTSSSDDLPPNDDPCKHCGLPNHPELILLCDSCDSGYHTACLRPPLMIIPDGEWFCPPCQHKLLCDKLEEQLQNLDVALKKKERAERRKERLVYVGISVENIIAPTVEAAQEERQEEVVKEKKEVKKKSWGRRSTRAKKYISYRFDEFDEAIEEAIEEDIKEAEGGGAGRGKDMANITGHRGKDISTILQEGGKENGRPKRTSAGQRRKKRRRLNDLDSDSTVDEEESEEEFRLSDSSEEEEFVVSENEVNSEGEAQSFDDSDFGGDGRVPTAGFSSRRRPTKRWNRRPRMRRRPRGYSDDEELEETDEEEEEEIVTEGSSEFSDSDLDMRRRRSHRSQKKQVNYRETSDSDASQGSANRDKAKKRRRLSSSESEVSFRSMDSDEEDGKGKKQSVILSEEETRKRRRRLSLKRRRESEDEANSSDSDDSEEEERPIRKRVNRIDSDDSDEEEEEEEEKEKEKEKRSTEKEAEETVAKVVGPLDYSMELPPTNGQSPIKTLEGLITKPTTGVANPVLVSQVGLKNSSAPPQPLSVGANGLVPQEMAPQDEDEDDLLGVTDLVDYVCNSEQL